MSTTVTLETTETYDGVPLSQLFPQEKLGWRGYSADASHDHSQHLTQGLRL